MLDFFSWIVVFLKNIGTFLSSLIDGLITLIRVVNNVVSFPLAISGFLPGFLFSSVVICVSIWVIKLVVGR